jgi:excisionase family DNA binding protein
MPNSPQETTPALPELMTVKEMAEYLRIPIPTIYYLAQRWQLPGALQIGGRWRIKKSVVDKVLLKKDTEWDWKATATVRTPRQSDWEKTTPKITDIARVAFIFHDKALGALAHASAQKIPKKQKLQITDAVEADTNFIVCDEGVEMSQLPADFSWKILRIISYIEGTPLENRDNMTHVSPLNFWADSIGTLQRFLAA